MEENKDMYQNYIQWLKDNFNLTPEQQYSGLNVIDELKSLNDEFKLGTFDILTFEEYKQSIHPFFGSLIEDYMTYEGDTVIKNTLSSSIIDYLLMDYDQLEKVSGSSSAQKYKQSIIIITHDKDVQKIMDEVIQI